MREVERQHLEEKKERFSGDPEMEGVPEEEGVEGADVEERLDEDPETVPNRRDVPED